MTAALSPGIPVMALVFDPERNADRLVEDGRIDFDPGKYKTVAGAAKAFHKALCKYASEQGFNTDVEIFIHTPEESKRNGQVSGWRVGWESGPYEWAIHASFEMTGPWGYCECYYRFDLCFVDDPR